MTTADAGTRSIGPADIERWLADLGLAPGDRAERDGIASWDLVLDGRRRSDLRVTVIMAPGEAIICWAHYAPPISDAFRKAYRRLLRWNDEFPFAKFGITDDERPTLTVEIALSRLAEGDADGAERLGLALTRILGVADRLVDESADLIWGAGRRPARAPGGSRNGSLLDRFAAQLPELFGSDA
jgi:Putative bacterial sensory transduction regulator